MTKLIALVIVLTAATARADDAPSWKVSVDTDPTTFAFDGFSGWVMTKPAHTEHVRFGIGGFGLQFPSFLTPHLNGTGEDGWTLDVRAVMGFAGYMFGDRSGLYVGAYSGYLQSRHRRDDSPGMTASEDNLTVLPTVGYQWFPFHRGALAGAYLQPWAGATIWIPVGGSTTVGTHTFKDPHIIPIAAFHVGYEF